MSIQCPSMYEGTMQRIQIDLPEETVKELENLAAKKGTSRAEIIRQAIDIIIKIGKSETTNQELSLAFGLWKKNPMTDEELQSLRDGWGQ